MGILGYVSLRFFESVLVQGCRCPWSTLLFAGGVLHSLCFCKAEQRFWGITAATWAGGELSFVPDIDQVTLPVVAFRGVWLGVEIPLEQFGVIMKNRFKGRMNPVGTEIALSVLIISQSPDLATHIHSAKLKRSALFNSHKEMHQDLGKPTRVNKDT